jgi:hypothetical protein
MKQSKRKDQAGHCVPTTDHPIDLPQQRSIDARLCGRVLPALRWRRVGLGGAAEAREEGAALDDVAVDACWMNLGLGWLELLEGCLHREAFVGGVFGAAGGGAAGGGGCSGRFDVVVVDCVEEGRHFEGRCGVMRLNVIG